MELIQFTEEDYDFKKALQKNIIKNFQPILYSNKFIKCLKNIYVRELNGLAQFVRFGITRNELEVWATYMPIFIRGVNVVRYGVEITGSSGMDLLDGKYYTSIRRNTNGFGQKVELQHYYDEIVPRLEKIIFSIVEGVIPQMDQMNSFERFVQELQSPTACFFGRKYDYLKGGSIQKLFAAIDMLFKEQFTEGIIELKEIVGDMYANGYQRDPYNDFSEKMLECLDCDASQMKNNFQLFMEQVSNEIRKEYKLIK